MKKLFLLIGLVFLFGGLPAVSSAQSPNLPPGQLVKAKSSAAVYYIDEDLRRHVFPNLRVFNSWYQGFGDIIEVSDEEISDYPIGGLVPYHPGKRLVKLTTDPKVYAVDDGGVLRWVKSEAAARALYGTNWNKFVDDLSDAFFTNYEVGDPVTGPGDFDIRIQNRVKKIATTLATKRWRHSQEDSEKENHGFGHDKVAVCHNFGNGGHTIYIARPALQAHLKQGDTEGRCSDESDDSDDNDDDGNEADTVAPVVSGVEVSNITASGATVSWSTNEETSYTIYYDAADTVDQTIASSLASGVRSTGWEVALSGLEAETTYRLVIVAADEAGNETTSDEYSFTTLVSDETAPVISDFSAAAIVSETAIVSWSTDEPADYALYYADASPVNVAAAASVSADDFESSRSVELTGLTAETVYHAVVVCSDEAGNETTSEEISFTTPASI